MYYFFHILYILFWVQQGAISAVTDVNVIEEEASYNSGSDIVKKFLGCLWSASLASVLSRYEQIIVCYNWHVIFNTPTTRLYLRYLRDMWHQVAEKQPGFRSLMFLTNKI